jgi:putative cardiolipin synthase
VFASGVERLVAVRERGIDVTVITNSLAANNQFSVHAGYAPSRKPLLEAGVKLFEVRPGATMEGATLVAASGAKATLHTKAFLIDRTEVFIGSFNFDPRSAWLNTEMGVLIDNHAMALRFADYVQSHMRDQAYEVFLDENGELRWRAFDDGEERICDKEPESTWWDRFKVGFVRILPIKRQL